MNNKLALAAAALVALTALGGVVAEEHAEEALKHANDAANTPGDSRAIREHAAEALKHIDSAKEANAHRPEVIQHLERGEAELKDAIEHASHYNATSASDTASGAKTHLERAHDAADTPPSPSPAAPPAQR
jgi:hypothetical protein